MNMNMNHIFDYKFYINEYIDLKDFSYLEALQHWKKYGIVEGRKCSQTYYEIKKDDNKILISIHLYYEDMFSNFVLYIKNVISVFTDYIIIFTLKNESKFDDKILKIFPESIILKIPNKGGDFNSFLESIKYIRKNQLNISYILKLHTKKDNKWLQELVEPITKYENLLILKKYFDNIENIGYVGAQKWILPKEYDLDFPQNIECVNMIINKFNYLNGFKWTDFQGGGTFWINNQVLEKYLTNELIEFYQNNFMEGKPPCNLNDKNMYIEYSWERVITGVFIYHKTNILINENIYHPRSLGKDNEYIQNVNVPQVFSFHRPYLL